MPEISTDQSTDQIEIDNQNINFAKNQEYFDYLQRIMPDEDNTPKGTYLMAKKIKNGITININGYDVNSYLSIQIPHKDPHIIQWKEFPVIITKDKIFDVNINTGEIIQESKKFFINNGKILIKDFKKEKIENINEKINKKQKKQHVNIDDIINSSAEIETELLSKLPEEEILEKEEKEIEKEIEY